MNKDLEEKDVKKESETHTQIKDFAANYKGSIHDSKFTPEEISMIWDFYVTKSIAGSSGQKRPVKDYRKTNLPIVEMMEKANLIGNYNFKMCDSIKDTLKKMDLMLFDTKKVKDKKVPREIEIATPRMVCMRDYSVDEDEKLKSKSGEAECLLRHIRNAFAHGNTYFLKNENVILEDKNGGNTTAMILIKQQTLLDWIFIIDDKEVYYKKDVATNETKIQESTISN